MLVQDVEIKIVPREGHHFGMGVLGMDALGGCPRKWTLHLRRLCRAYGNVFFFLGSISRVGKGCVGTRRIEHLCVH